MLAATHNSPQPLAESGHTFPTRVAPFIRYALSFSPYIYWSLPFTIPHSISIAAAPVTIGVAKDVPVTILSLFPGILILTPGAVMSGFAYSRRPLFTLTPLPENVAALPGSRPLAPTHIARLEVPGIVNVYSGDGLKNPVALLNVETGGRIHPTHLLR